MRFDTLAGLREGGFSTLEPIETLRATRLSAVPRLPGVYLVVRAETTPPVFLDVSPAGWFKGRDPTLPISELQAAWVPESLVLYIGKAGGLPTRATLRQRLATYLRHGAGVPAAHWGGRAIWQLADAEKLRIAWRVAREHEMPREVERQLLAEFCRDHGRRPFANRTG